ncbi:hypothetical protein N5J48_11720 [Acinetobacter ursingii]|uniref:hypothetical protein n=1 Tax=Acinetobacter ursingii TaxID=108980 RepID=UPI00124BFF8E|nr:hypothetical protein [Acinetobacter ursingii]MDG9860983.1 hypothetical protein [Acinetobacter ursingii]MDG9892235.1 hypothetical protein [Acinetobacter ursingii]MDH0005948.1 hypothetical protein [Acinetobacter ursingii]MDH0477486.1 hypothetical protein [Acinetobacter ursingii]MDH2118325.1 hypothetical protein [Acinetobacter ursingii]
MSLNYKKQNRSNRYNVNLTDDEADFFGIISKMTGVPRGTIIRQLAVKGALQELTSEQEFNLESILNQGAEKHRLGS